MSLVKKKYRTTLMPQPDSPDNNYGRLEIKMKNICCVFCKKTFVIRDHFRFGKSTMPLARSCGHVICDTCSKVRAHEACPVCKDTPPLPGCNQSTEPTLHVYVMGLLNINRPRLSYHDDPKLNFEKSLKSKAQHIAVAERCHECAKVASVKCIPCKNTYCKSCFSNLHVFKTNKHHMMTPLDASLANLVYLPIFCDQHKDQKFTHWCENCEEPCCHDCGFEIHRTHTVIRLREKNLQILDEFQEACANLGDTFLLTRDSRKRVAEALKVPDEPESVANIEAEINQHFLHLHGVLQNIEGKMIETLRAQMHRQERNLQEIDEQLERIEKNLEAGVLVATSVEQHFDHVHLFEVIHKLVSLAESPCHFVHDQTKPTSETIKFHSKLLDIVPCLEKHCRLEVEAMPSSVHLLPRTFLPVESLPDVSPDLASIPALFENDKFHEKIASQSFTSLSSLASSGTPPSTETETIRPAHTSIPLFPDSSKRMNYFDVYITHIDSPSSFYIRYAAEGSKWATVQEKLKTYDYAVIPHDIKLRKNYAVKSADTWLRASVIGVVPDHEKNLKTYDVHFIDVGAQERGVIRENIRELEDSLSEIEPLAKNYSLYDIKPKGKATWEPEARAAMLEVVQYSEGETLTMRTYEESSNGIDVLCPNKKKWYAQSIRDHLIFLGFGAYSTHERLYSINPESVAALHHDRFEQDTFTHVVLTEFFNPDATPNCMYVRKGSYMESTFNKMMDDLQRDYDRNKHTRGKVYTPEIGLICAARSSSKKWYRAVVVGTPGNQNVQVLYVDYGFTETIKYSSLRQLDTVYMKAATRAIKISLKDVAPLNGVWSPQAMIQLREWMQACVKLVAYEKIDDYFSVTVVDTLNNENLNARLVKMGFAESTGPASRQPNPRRIPELLNSPDSCESVKIKPKRYKGKCKKSKTRDNSSSDALRTPTKKAPKDIFPKIRDIREDDPWKVHVTPLRIISPDEIYVSPFDIDDKYSEMDKALQRSYRTFKASKDRAWLVGNVCVIKLKTSNVFRRAEIREINSPEEVLVYLLDIGDSLVVSLEDLQPLLEEFNDVPANVVLVKLGGIYPPGGSVQWPTASCDKLKEIVEENQGSRFFISKISEDDSPMIVDFFVEETKCFGAVEPAERQVNVINQKLVEAGLALPIRNFSDTKVKILGADVEKALVIGDKNPVVEVFEEAKETSDDDTDDSGTIKDYESDESDVPTEEPNLYCSVLPEDSPAWLPPEAIPDDIFIGPATFVDWKAFVYFVTAENNLKLTEINRQLQDVYQMDRNVDGINNWQIGDLCIVKMHRFNTWHRAQVRGKKNNHLVVCFVDYGNIEWMSTSEVRKKLMFEDVPILVSKCKIFGMTPNNTFKSWTKLDLDRMHNILVGRKWRVEILQRMSHHLEVAVSHPSHPHENIVNIMRKFMIEVIIDTGESSGSGDTDVVVEEVLVADDPEEILMSEIDLDAQYVSDSPEEVTPPYDEVVSVRAEKLIRDFHDNCVEIYPAITLPDGIEMFYGALGEVSRDRATTIWVHPAGTPGCEFLTALSQMYSKLMKEMDKEAEEQPLLEVIEAGVPCCAVYESDQSWYRGRVVSVMNDGETTIVQVNFVDWGNSEWINSTDLRVPKETWLRVPATAIKCYLHGLRVGEDNSMAREWLKKFGTSKNHPLTIRVEARIEDCLSIQLFVDRECQMLLYQSLIEKGMFKKDVRKVLEEEFA
ncbi:tudor domain-containing protein 1 isoform X2 [Diachasma alloeum]|uniref:tudor domain-containing protein 1 isoform X2 n=1 Tax=Diachasma alloeum TaxID=454923 RepID=UPI0007383D87|nr:tudor domain-containing protein 1 isoform X2 [Diachasma alloeum]